MTSSDPYNEDASSLIPLYNMWLREDEDLYKGVCPGFVAAILFLVFLQ